MEYNDISRKARQDMSREETEQMMLNIILTALESNFNRARLIKDPVTRHILFLEKLLAVKDIFVASLDAIPMTEDTKIRSQKLCTTINGEVESLIDWIQQPIYSPDHPIGNSMMKEAEKDFSALYR